MLARWLTSIHNEEAADASEAQIAHLAKGLDAQKEETSGKAFDGYILREYRKNVHALLWMQTSLFEHLQSSEQHNL